MFPIWEDLAFEFLTSAGQLSVSRIYLQNMIIRHLAPAAEPLSRSSGEMSVLLISWLMVSHVE